MGSIGSKSDGLSGPHQNPSLLPTCSKQSRLQWGSCPAFRCWTRARFFLSFFFFSFFFERNSCTWQRLVARAKAESTKRDPCCPQELRLDPQGCLWLVGSGGRRGEPLPEREMAGARPSKDYRAVLTARTSKQKSPAGCRGQKHLEAIHMPG